jgi:hypothetical protein
MKQYIKKSLHLLSNAVLFPVLLIAHSLSGETIPAPFPNGANALFAGHSFFVPVALAFDTVASENDYSNHTLQSVFRGGASGSPRRLWEDETAREKVVEALEAQPVELFGLTWFGEEFSSFDDYKRWFDLALNYNPEMHFFIGQPWMGGGPSLETTQFAEITIEQGENTFLTVERLREAYPDNRITFINYGLVGPIMKEMFEAGTLPDIEALAVEPGGGISADKCLFADSALGHAGPMMTELCALTWAISFYGAELDSDTRNKYQSDVEGILDATMVFNEAYREMDSHSGEGYPIPGSTEIEDSMYHSDWLGLYLDADPYIYSYEHGWLYMIHDDGNYFFHDSYLGWLWTSPTIYPFLYSFTADDLLYYVEGQDPRIFYDYNSMSWSAIPKN